MRPISTPNNRRGIFIIFLTAFLLLTCTLSDNSLTRATPDPIKTSSEETSMPKETKEPGEGEETKLGSILDHNTPETEETVDISSEVIIPDYEPLDLAYSEWGAHRSQELLTANGFGENPAEWRRAAGHSSGFIRGTAFYLLVQQLDPADESLFRQGLADFDQTVQSLSAFALVRLGDSTAAATLQHIAQLDAEAILSAPLAAGLLAELGDPSGIKTMKMALSSELGYVRLNAVQYLPSFVPLHGLEDGSGQTIDVWDLYCQAMKDVDIQVKATAEMQLQELNSAEALELLGSCGS
jgi:hypothetical protein